MRWQRTTGDLTEVCTITMKYLLCLILKLINKEINPLSNSKLDQKSN